MKIIDELPPLGLPQQQRIREDEEEEQSGMRMIAWCVGLLATAVTIGLLIWVNNVEANVPHETLPVIQVLTEKGELLKCFATKKKEFEEKSKFVQIRRHNRIWDCIVTERWGV